MIWLARRFFAAAAAFYIFVHLLIFAGPLFAAIGGWLTWRVLT